MEELTHLSIDLETYSDIDIKASGLYRYVQSPAFQILLFAYAIDDNPVDVVSIVEGEEVPADVLNMLRSPDVVKHAYNAAFEITCLSKYLNTPLDPAQWRCTMLHGLYCGYPMGLDAIGNALGLPEDSKKMAIGKSLIRYFCVPCKPSKANGQRTRNLPQHDPDKWALFKQYNARDVETERTVEQLLSNFPVPDEVQRDWVIDMSINWRGIRIDTCLVNGALAVSEKVTEQLTAEAVRLTGLDNPRSVAQLKAWLETETDTEIDSLNKKAVADMLAAGISQDNVQRVLEIRQELSKSSVKKYDAMLSAMGDKDFRVRGLLQYYGANRTGRWAGRLVQVQNLPQNHIPDLDLGRQLVRNLEPDMIKLVYGSVPAALSQLIRTAFIPSEGCKYVVADFSAIEARVIAWYAGETWRQEVFAAGGDIYCASASQMFHVPVEKHGVNGHLRQKGKVAELALGYQGAAGALIAMGALDMGLTADELPGIVQKWRAASPHIVRLWYDIERAALKAMESYMAVPYKDKGIIFRREGDIHNDFLTVQLPSGRKLYYCHPEIRINDIGRPAIYYNEVGQISKKWGASSTYGGKLVENIVQATARDCLAIAIRRLHKAGYDIVMHIHDEVVIDCPKEKADLEGICKIMCAPIPWAPGLLLNADGFVGDYYKKD